MSVAKRRKKRRALDWEKSSAGSDAVFFPGGFQLYVINQDRLWRETKRWRVWWGDGEPQIKGLTDRWFKTRAQAMRAAENVFVPMLTIGRKLYRIETTLFHDQPG